MFKPVDNRQSFPKLEAEVLDYWKQNDTFKKSVDQRPEDNIFVFYEGPPTANARPGVHHVMGRVFKDLFPRYKTMRGYQVPRKGGWDTHGLPVELEVERALGIKSKPEIEEFGVEEFNRRCRDSVFTYVQEWERLTDRIGFWIDTDDAYVTYRNEYIESVWWIVRQFWENNLLYLDYRSTPHCPRCVTTLSDAEVSLGYKENTPDPSVYVKFRLTPKSAAKLRKTAQIEGDERIGVVAWTTTPWTLPANTALAVKPDAAYGVYRHEGALLVLARELAARVLGDDAQEVRWGMGSGLVGLKYEPQYDVTAWGVPTMTFDGANDGRLVPRPLADVEAAYTIFGADFVSMEDGTGVVHIAPAFGGEDFQLGKEHGLLFVQTVDLRGLMPERSSWAGQFVKVADKGIIEDLTQRGLMLKSETIKHTYPFCWRCDTPLLYYAKPTWYVRTTAVKDRLIEGNQQINWYPEHIKTGRFGDWLRNNIDWGLSRERYWGTPLPIWRCTGCDAVDCIGSREMMRARAVDPAAVDALEDFHRPYIDRIELRCESCGGAMKRVPELMDVWFDSGAMPYAQWHYPFENKEKFAKRFPADFICEAVDQTRGWFYTLHAEAVLLNSIDPATFKTPYAYKNVICHGHILDEKGRKMSKSLGNTVDPWTVIDESGADALRWYMITATRPGDPRRFSDKLVQESLRRFLLTYWNTYSFFVTYANLDNFDPTRAGSGTPTDLDRWLLSELNELVRRVTSHLDEYDMTAAGRLIQDFVDDLSNWYVRRSRRRFWKGDVDDDKTAAYQTLYIALTTVTKVMAPFTPFVAEAVHQNLVCSVDREAPESVHLADWPQQIALPVTRRSLSAGIDAMISAPRTTHRVSHRTDALLVDEELMADTRLVMRIATAARAARQKAGIKVRKPLAKMLVVLGPHDDRRAATRLEDLSEEVNVRLVIFGQAGADARDSDPEFVLENYPVVHTDSSGMSVGLDTNITPELADEGLARELVHRIQNLRKSAGLEIEDRIVVRHSGSERLRSVFASQGDYVRAETLADDIAEGTPSEGATSETAKVEGEEVTLSVQKS